MAAIEDKHIGLAGGYHVFQFCAEHIVEPGQVSVFVIQLDDIFRLKAKCLHKVIPDCGGILPCIIYRREVLAFIF